jgi:hypothetical protein
MTAEMTMDEKRIVDNIENLEMQSASERSKLDIIHKFDNLSNEEITTLEKRRK